MTHLQFSVHPPPPPHAPLPLFLSRVTCTPFKHPKRMTARAACEKSSRLLETSTHYPVPKRLVHGKPEIGHRYGGPRGGGGRGRGRRRKKPLLPPIAKSACLPSENICLQCQDEGRYYGRLYFFGLFLIAFVPRWGGGGGGGARQTESNLWEMPATTGRAPPHPPTPTPVFSSSGHDKML